MLEETTKLSPAKATELAESLGPLVRDLRTRRKPIDERWLLFHAAYTGRHTRTFFNSDMFKHFIPAARRALERFAVRGSQMVVPSADFFEVYPGDLEGTTGDKEANSVRSWLRYVLVKRIKAYVFVRTCFRMWGIYGRVVTKTGVEVLSVPERDGTVTTQVWPTARVVDPFYFYAYPETVNDPARLQVMAEDFMLPWDQYVSLMAQGIVSPLKREDLTSPEWPDHQVRRLQEQSLTDPSTVQTTEKSDDLAAFVSISEVWLRREGRWQRVWIAWNVTGGEKAVRFNPRPFPVPPYRIALARELPSEHYTTGMMDDLEPMQVLLNDQFNIALEGQATNFSPPTIVDPNRVYRHSSLVYRPRAKWLADPEGIKFFESRDITRYAFQGIQFTLGLMDSFSGSNPLAEGQPTRNLPRAGFAVSSLLNLSLADIKDAAQVIEDCILTPLLGDLYRLTLEYADPAQVVKIPGTQDWPARKFSISELVGDWDFQWVGSLQAQDMQVKAQRMVAILGMLGKVGPIILQDLQTRGKRLNWEALLKRIWRDGLGERGLDRIIEEMTPEEIDALKKQQMMALMMGGARGGAGGGKPGAYPMNAEAMDRQTARGMTDEGAGL